MMTSIPTKGQKGFTLIELVMVIVILGILAAFALPRFADLGGDAERASVEGARGSVKSAMGIVRSKALAEGKGGAGTDSVSLEGETIATNNGYLDASSVSAAAQLEDFTVQPATPTDTAHVTVADPSDGSPCFQFNESTGENSPATVSDVRETWSTTSSTCPAPTSP